MMRGGIHEYIKEEYMEILRKMLQIRLFEEMINKLAGDGTMPGNQHSYRGQEAVAVGVCSSLEPTDMIASTHRGNGHMVAKDLDIYRLFAELLGKDDGYGHGRGGKLHLVALEKGFLGTYGVVGSSVPIACGAAYAAQVRKSGQVVISFMGDGAINQGAVHEAMNMASLWKLPVVFVVENNLYAFTVSLERSSSDTRLAHRAAAYNMEGLTVDGNDVLAVKNVASWAIGKARGGGGPTLLECLTYRWDGHFHGDPGTTYRSREEVQEWRDRCPIKNYAAHLMKTGVLTEEGYNDIYREVKEQIETATAKAIEAALPDPSVALGPIYAEVGK
jgi:TPP-dependent pyruvate/acetoin dehydrogenase alpha subunit